jgi:hypothetical protein
MKKQSVMVLALVFALAPSAVSVAQSPKESSPFDRYRQATVNELEFRKLRFDVACLNKVLQERSLLSSGFSAPQVEGETPDGKLLIQVDVWSSELPATVDARKQGMMGAVELARAGFSYAFGTPTMLTSFDKWTRIQFFDVDALLKSKTKKPVDPYIGVYEDGQLVLR